jgi:hypothetical protein
MKSYNLVIVFALTILAGCGRQDTQSPMLVNDQSRIVDSLKTVILQKDSAYNNLRSDYHSWVVHTFDTESQAIAFAQIVKRNTANAVFNEGWVKRKFLWTHQWKKKKK